MEWWFFPLWLLLKGEDAFIQEKEAEAIRLIYDKFANTDIGYNGVAQYLNLQGIEKIQRQNGKLKEWSGSFVRRILDNPVYCGKIAFGKRA